MPFMIAAGIGAAGSLVNGFLGADAANSAAKAQENAANGATSAEMAMFDQTRSDLSPFLTGGTNALSALQSFLNIGPGTTGQATNPILNMLGIGPGGKATGAGIDPSKFIASPGYQFQLQQGLDAVTNSAAARGGLGGNALKALQQYGSGLANQGWQQYLGNVNTGWNGMVNALAGLTNTGLNAGNVLGNWSMKMGQMQGSNIMDAGNAQSAGIIGSTNAITGGINGALQNIMPLFA